MEDVKKETENEVMEEVKEPAEEVKPEANEDSAVRETESDLLEEVPDENVELPEKKKKAVRRTARGDVLDDDPFKRRSVHQATRAEKHDLYHDERVITNSLDEELVDQGVAKERRDEWLKIVDAATSRPPKTLVGVIVGMKLDEEDGKPMAVVNLKDSKGHYNIYIPATQLVNYGNSDEFSNEIWFDEIRSRIDSVINFIPYESIEGKDILASRVMAMSLDARRSYEYPIMNGKPLIQPGVSGSDLVQARVVKVSARGEGVIVEVNGAECYIPNSEISYNRIVNANDILAPGDMVRVKVLSAKPRDAKVAGYSETIRLYDITASIKLAGPKPSEVFFDKFEVNGIYSGVVKGANNLGKYFVSLGGKMDCLCLPTRLGTPVPNQKVTVQITEMKTFEGGERQIWGKIIRLGRIG